MKFTEQRVTILNLLAMLQQQTTNHNGWSVKSRAVVTGCYNIDELKVYSYLHQITQT